MSGISTVSVHTCTYVYLKYSNNRSDGNMVENVQGS